MKEVIGDLWSEVGRAGLLLVTTNDVVKANGELVMGRGVARCAAKRYPSLPRQLGGTIQRYSGGPYGVVLSGISDSGTRIGAFQVKRHWGDPADLKLINYSVGVLIDIWVPMFARVAMNFPGIGNGRLDRMIVLPLLQHLPDSVFVYRW